MPLKFSNGKTSRDPWGQGQRHRGRTKPGYRALLLSNPFLLCVTAGQVEAWGISEAVTLQKLIQCI